MTETQQKVYDAFVVSAKAWFEMEAERLEWTTMRNISNLCKTYLASFVEDVEDGITCVDNRLVLELGVFHDCSRTPTTPCEGCSEVESIFYCISTDSDSNDLLQEWEALFNDDPSPFMPDCFQWDGDNTDPEIKDEDDDEDGVITLDDDDDIPVKNVERDQPCPKCGQPCKLTSLQVLVGYSCDRCMYGDSNDPGY
jgi:hypothetical protein